MRVPNRMTLLVEQATELRDFAARRLIPLVDLAMRLWLAQYFLRAGILKIHDPDPTVWLFSFVAPLPGISPELATAVLTIIEVAAPVLLVSGLMTRLSALSLIPGSVLIYLAYPRAAEPVFVLLLLGLLFVRGAGSVSLDAKFTPALASSALPFTRVSRAVAKFLTGYLAPAYLAAVRLGVALIFLASGWILVHGTMPGMLAGLPRFGLAMSGPGALAETMDPSVAALLSGTLILPAAILLGVGLATGLSALVLAAFLALFALLGGGAPHFPPAALLLLFIAFDRPGAFAMDRLVRMSLVRAFPSIAPDADWLAGAPHVVVVGGGFGGIATVLGLRHARVRVTLVDRRNYHLFQPLLYQVATATLSPADVATPIRSLMRGIANCRVVMGRVSDVDTGLRQVVFDDGQRMPYDHLVLATGAKHSYFGKDEWEPFAPGLKKIDDATAIRRAILLAFEKAEAATDPEERRRLLNFVIVGGGPTGVELAGAIAELARQGLEGEFSTIDPAEAHIVLVQSAPRLLPAMPERLSAKAREALEQLGVDVRTDHKVERIDETGVTIGKEWIESRTVIWAAGVAASPAGRWVNGERDRAGRVVVTPELRVGNYRDIYAIGDTASCDPDGSGPLPGLAAVAKQQGQHIARHLRAVIEGGPLPGPFRYRDYGSMATIGRERAVANLRGVQLSGAPAWWLWCAVHVAFMADMRNRLSVIVDWVWSYLTFSRRIRLITGNPAMESDV